MSDRRSILLLCDDSRRHAGNVLEHIAGITNLSRHEVYRFNPVDRPHPSAALDLDEFDVVVIHYTIFVAADRYLPPVLADKISRFGGLKVQFLQDEYRQVDAITARSRGLGVHVLFTCAPPPQRQELYGGRLPDVELVTTLPGFAPDGDSADPARPIAARPIDVGYRGRDVPYWLGRLGHEKTEIGSRFVEAVRGRDLRCDISTREEKRIYGPRWWQFLLSCKTTLGTESGASIVDFDGSLEARTRQYLIRHPDASFEEVEEKVLAPLEGNLTIAVAPPRLFEAAALGTALILFPGKYSGTVEAWRHFVPLEKDFSNVEEVVRSIRDTKLLEELAMNAHADLVQSGRYSLAAFVREFDELIAARSEARSRGDKTAFRRASGRRRVSVLRRPSRLRRVAVSALKPPVALALVLRDPTTRRLATTFRGDGRLVADLWRLATLRRLASAEAQFDLRAEVEDEGRRLMLVSQPGHAGAEGAALGAEARIELADVKEIVWDHSAVGLTVPLLGRRLLAAPVGTRGVPGAYGFEALVALSRTSPEAILEALDPLLRSAGRR